jgi:alpha/beta superfamily hydrolase
LKKIYYYILNTGNLQLLQEIDMSEEKIYFNSSGLKIEGLLENLPGDNGAVITHPHPLYGGDMYNSIVDAVCRAYREKGYSTLRFNFRGMGGSEGAYDNGTGEQDDVKSALEYLAGIGKENIDLAGYSFGAWVNCLGIEKYDKASRLVMVSPPVGMIDFSFLKHCPKIKLVIAGSMDDIAGYHTIERMLPVWNPEADLKIIEGADHFYTGKTAELKAILSAFL